MISIKDLSFSYGSMPVFDGINLEFEKGAIYGLLGENGVGKTTLLKIIAGLQPPRAGRCTVDGHDAFKRDAEFLQNIIFMPDEMQLPVGLTPQHYVRAHSPFYEKYNEQLFYSLMQELNVDAERKFSQMSFGQKKKSLIACALSFGVDYLLLDEPTNGLDIPSKSDFRRLLAERSYPETAIIISTHQVRDVENLIDPITIITRNDVLLKASIAEITDKLLFEYGSVASTDALYSEMSPAGFLNVRVNKEHKESVINIEALFNAVLRNPQLVKQLFSK